MKNNKNQQIKLYSLDTSAFYTDKEEKINKYMLLQHGKLKRITELLSDADRYQKLLAEMEVTKTEIGILRYNLNKLETDSKEYKKFVKEFAKKNKKMIRLNDSFAHEKFNLFKKLDQCNKLPNLIDGLNQSKKDKGKFIKLVNKRLVTELEKFKGIRSLREESLKDSCKISQFQSTLSRTLGVNAGETTTDIFMIRAFRYVVFESLVKNGFKYLDQHYQYFTSTAGMIRNKKSIFVSSTVADSEEFKNKIWCGLSKEKINSTKFPTKLDPNQFEKGINLSKMNAYLGLCMTSSIPFEDFNIDEAIVVADFEKMLKKQHVHYISKENNYEVKEDRNRKIAINVVDGCGIMLSEISNKSLQFRMPGFKGLLIPFPIYDFIKEVGKMEDCTVIDIYGDSHDIIADEIKYIFTASQFKLASYYNNWEEYKEAFKKGCEFVICKEEDDKFPMKPLSYQMIQTLSDITPNEMRLLAAATNKKIAEIEDSRENMLSLLGVDKEDDEKDSFQKALSIYPELITDEYVKEKVRSARDSLFMNAKAGKLYLKGTKRTFMSPDLYAFAEWLFLGIKNPKGLINKGRVSCRLYKNGTILNTLRSPHLFREHIIRQNIVDAETSKWFISNCIYMSSHNLDCSNVLMADFDGDEAVINSHPLFIKIAKRNMKGILPLDYELSTASREILDDRNENMYKSLKRAYSKNQSIGDISNKITKEWSKPQEKIDLDLIRQLVYLNNASIDFAKSSWFPEFPTEIQKKIKELNKEKLANFFIYAKGKEPHQVNLIPDNKSVSVKEKEEILKNVCAINKLEYIIEKNNMSFSKVSDKFDYRFLMKKKKVVRTDKQVIAEYKNLNKKKKFQLEKELQRQGYSNSITELTTHSMIRHQLLKVNDDIDAVVDNLIQYLYVEKPDAKKTTLWEAFGDVLLRNIQNNLENESGSCEKCDTRFRKVNKKKVLCDKCKKIEDRRQDTIRKREDRENQSSDKKFAG